MARKLVDAKEIAQQLGLSPSTVYKWCYQSKIPHYRLGRAVRFDPVEIWEWLRSPDQEMRQNGTSVKWGKNGISNKLNRNRNAT